MLLRITYLVKDLLSCVSVPGKKKDAGRNNEVTIPVVGIVTPLTQIFSNLRASCNISLYTSSYANSSIDTCGSESNRC